VVKVQSEKYLLAPVWRLKVKQPASSAKTYLFGMVHDQKDKFQAIRFRETAPPLECDESEAAFDRALKKGGESATTAKRQTRSGFGRLLVRRLNGPEVLPALSDDRDAPASQLGSARRLLRGLTQRHVV